MKASSSGRASALASDHGSLAASPSADAPSRAPAHHVPRPRRDQPGGRPHGTPPRRAATAPPPSFFISGRGWGHGVGMSQWGAYGYAQRGTPYDQILAHYYPLDDARQGARRARARPARRGPQGARRRVRRRRSGPRRLGHRRTSSSPGPTRSVPALKVKVDRRSRPRRSPAPLVFLPGATPLKYGGKQYRGQLQVTLRARRCSSSTRSGSSRTSTASCRARCRTCGPQRR